MNDDGTLLINLTRGNIVCDTLEVADTARRRMRGLLGRGSLPSGEGLLLHPAPSIHTAFMRFAIDAVFLDGTLRVRRIVADMPPWRAASVSHAWAVLELAAGEAARTRLSIGDQLGLVEVNDRIGAVVTALANKKGVTTSELDAITTRVARDEKEAQRGAPAPATIVVAGSDRRFRAVAGALLLRRGSRVVLCDRVTDAAAVAAREEARVVVLDAGRNTSSVNDTVQQLARLNPAVGVVLVADEGHTKYPQPVLAKWDSFETLCAAIEAAVPEDSYAAHL